MKVLFFSGSDFSLPLVEKLIELGHTVGIVTNPTVELRGKLIKNKLVITAEKNTLFLWQPISLRKIDSQEVISICSCYDIAIVASYGKIIPQLVLDQFQFGAINWHPSLLPLYRGPTPVQTSIANGDTTTGLTWIKMDDKMDEGNIVLQRTIQIENLDTFSSVITKAVEAGIETVEKVLSLSTHLETGTPQDSTQATYTSMLKRNSGLLQPLDHLSVQIVNCIRAYSVFPKTFVDGGDLGIVRLDVVKISDNIPLIFKKYGIFMLTDLHQLYLKTKDGYLQILKITLKDGKQKQFLV
jgi:methionyl-tRNA formyltransferase